MLFSFLLTGTLFSSMMFPDRAPSDVYLYTTFVGGSRNRELAKASRCQQLEYINIFKFTLVFKNLFSSLLSTILLLLSVAVMN